MGRTGQNDFGGGIFRGRNAPRDSVYDAIDGLVSDERELFRRGGSEIKSGSNADDTLLGMWEGHTVAGQRTLFWSDSSPYVLAADDLSIVDLGSVVPVPLASGVEIAGIVFFRGGLLSNYETEVVYAGSRKSAIYSTGTCTPTAGSVTVTGAGTAWLANVDPGMIILNPDSLIGVVKSVESDTSLTLTRPSQLNGLSLYAAHPIYRFELKSTAGGHNFPKNPTTAFHAVAGQRLIRVRDNRAYYTRPADDAEFLKRLGVPYPATQADFDFNVESQEYHELPRAALIIGADSILDTLILFTTAGVWTIENMALDALDDFGNRQRPVQQISQDLILWGEAGIASWANALVIPAVDDVYVMGLDGAPVAVSAGVRPLYREYVEAGYKPGLATVHRATYHLPILDGSNAVVDTLVCRLDLRDSRGGSRPAWTRWSGHASGRAYAQRVGATTREPKLLGLNGLRVTDLTGCYDPDAARKDDGDGTDHELVVVTQDLASGQIEHTFTGARVQMELVDAAADNPTFEVEYASGAVDAAYSSAGTRGEGDGERGEMFRFTRRCRALRLRISTSGAAARAVLRGIEVFWRDRGRS